MRLRVIAHFVLLIRPINSDEWISVKTYNLDQPVIRVGRAKECEIRVYFDEYAEICRAVSKYHATMYYYSNESQDFYIRDGALSAVTIQNPQPIPLPSRIGVYINTRNRRLGLGEKYLLKHRDEVHFIFNRLKFLYLRETKTVSEKLLEDTYIPPEYLL